jgi:O-antigen/teichoic acid export membrane protein
MILARMLSRSDFGIAATLTMIMTLLELSSKMGVAKCVVRDGCGEDPEFVSAAHAMQLCVGVAGAVAILAAAWPFALLFGIVDYTWAVASLALVPIVRGLEHLDVRRFERNLRFGPSSVAELLPQAVVALAAWPVAHWCRDYRAVVVLMLTKAALGCACTHWLAEKPYRWTYQPTYCRRIWQFGWPLILNSWVVFGGLQGEQFTIAAKYVMSDVGVYAAASAVALLPSFFFARVSSGVFLPLFASVQDNSAAFGRRYRQVSSMLACVAGSCAVGLMLAGEAIMTSIYGGKYAGTGLLLAVLAAAGALRTLRVSAALAALARGDSKNELYRGGRLHFYGATASTRRCAACGHRNSGCVDRRVYGAGDRRSV